jgi:3-hydroxypropanoate dehydrogenase
MADSLIDWQHEPALMLLSLLALMLLSFLALRTDSSAATFAAIVNARYSCKEFSSRLVSDSTLDALLALTQRAPTSFNTQPWVVVVVRDEAARARLVASLAPGNQLKALSAPINLVFAADCEPEKLLTADSPVFMREALSMFMEQASSPEAWAFKQTMTAAQTLMLAATAHGLQTNPMEGFRSMQAVRDAVGLPSRYSVPVVIALGYEKARREKPSPRYALDSVVHYDTFRAGKR